MFEQTYAEREHSFILIPNLIKRSTKLHITIVLQTPSTNQKYITDIDQDTK